MTVKEIKSYMKLKQITYQELSEESGIPLNTLKKIFSGKTEHPRIDTMHAIENALGIKKTTLFTDEDRTDGFIANTINVEINPDEDDLLYLYRRIGKQLGEAGQQAFKEMGETLLQIKNE